MEVELRDLFVLDVEEAVDLIKAMLQTEPSVRPKTDTILLHPLFWDATKKLQFFEVCGTCGGGAKSSRIFYNQRFALE